MANGGSFRWRCRGRARGRSGFNHPLPPCAQWVRDCEAALLLKKTRNQIVCGSRSGFGSIEDSRQYCVPQEFAGPNTVSVDTLPVERIARL